MSVVENAQRGAARLHRFVGVDHRSEGVRRAADNCEVTQPATNAAHQAQEVALARWRM